MSNKNQFTGRDAFYRMKYLHQIAEMCRQKPGDDYTKLMLHYGSQLVSIGKKTQSRMSPEMKRTICKVCNAILVPGDTEKIRLIKTKRQPDKMKSICVICGTEKIFNLRKDYQLWCEKPESIVRIIDTKENNKLYIKSKNKNESNGESSKPNLNIDKSSIDNLKHFVNSKKNISDTTSSTTVEDYSDKNKALDAKLMTDKTNDNLKGNTECKYNSSNEKLMTDKTNDDSKNNIECKYNSSNEKLMTDKTNDDSKNNIECKYNSSNEKLMKDLKSSITIEDLKNMVNSDKKNNLDLNLSKDSTISDLKDIVNSKKNTSDGNFSKTSDDYQKNSKIVDSSKDVDSSLMEIDETSNEQNSNGNNV